MKFRVNVLFSLLQCVFMSMVLIFVIFDDLSVSALLNNKYLFIVLTIIFSIAVICFQKNYVIDDEYIYIYSKFGVKKYLLSELKIIAPELTGRRSRVFIVNKFYVISGEKRIAINRLARADNGVFIQDYLAKNKKVICQHSTK